MNPTNEDKKYERRRWYSYSGALILLVFITIAEVAFYYREGLALLLYVASCLAMTFGTVLWCIYDSKARELQLSYEFRVRMWLLSPIFIPIYFYKTRGASQAAKSVFGLALYAPFYAAFYGTWYLTAIALTKVGYFSPA
jgi:hypothetical protein